LSLLEPDALWRQTMASFGKTYLGVLGA